LRLLKRFLRDVGSSYEPEDVVKIDNKRFTSPVKAPLDISGRVYTGIYLGRNKQRFLPSGVLLQMLGGEEKTHKVYVGRETAWLFVVGKDVFDENIIDKTPGVHLGGYCLVMYGEHCIGYGRYETSGDRIVVKNIYNIGDYLRRERE